MHSSADSGRDNGQAHSAIDITFDHKGDRLIGLGLINGILKVLTLGLYSFWGKTEVRRRIWSFTRLNGEPLEYTGTGKELFLGFLVIFGAVLLPTLLLGLAVFYYFDGSQAAMGIYQTGVYAILFMLVGNAMYRATRYRLSRTRWRGIRGGLAGSPQRYGWTYLWTLVLPFGAVIALSALVTWLVSPQVGGVLAVLGSIAALWIFPWRANTLQRIMTNDMRFGDTPLSYSGTSGPLYKRYFFAWAGSAILYVAASVATFLYFSQEGLIEQLQAKLPPSPKQGLTVALIWLATIIAIGLITAWYRANQMNHFANHTRIESANFKLQATGGSLMWLLFSNWMLAVFGLLAGLAIGGYSAYSLGHFEVAVAADGEPPQPGLLPILLVALAVTLTTTMATTFAQFRSARYFLSRLKLDGGLDLNAIEQSQSSGPKRGEGLAQVFDLDAF